MRRRFKQSEGEPVREKVLDVDASMQGTLSFNDPVNLRINGKFEGKLNTKGSLMVGEHASVVAEVVGEHITIAGKVRGNIKAMKEVRLISPADVLGNVDTPVLSVAEGAVVNGNIKMGAARGSKAAHNITLTLEEVAKYLEIDRTLVTEWADNGKLPGIKDGNNWRFDRAVVDNWLASEKIN